jgi:putative Ca2+/H+ antiporter (TMEM165/GDT1 family)
MEAFLVSAGSIATAEMGDRTQLLALLLAARFRRPWPIAAGILVATLANHAVAGLIGVWFGRLLTPGVLNTIVGISLLAMALWTLIPDKLDKEKGQASGGHSVFLTTLICFFLAEIGDKTQIATLALAAAYANLFAVIAGTTLGMLIANMPVVFLGNAFAGRLPMAAIHRASAAIFAVLGIVFLVRAATG